MQRFIGSLTLVLGTWAVVGCWSDEPISPAPGGSGGAAASTGGGPSSGSGGNPANMGGAMPAPNGYYTQGNRIYDQDGNEHRFRGVARPSLEWNHNGENLSPSDYQLMASWNANVVRIALSQGFWLEGSAAYAPEYKQTIDENIDWAMSAGLDVILDLHWSDKGNLGNWPEQQRMADANSVTFWQSVAERYKDNGRVLFELYNEPHDVSWQVWRNGGDSGDGFTAVGMQQLYDTVRGAGADNLVIIGGLHWAYDLSEVPSYRIDGYNIAYAAHLYNYSDKMPAAWESDWGFLTSTDPVMITEFGNIESCDSGYSQAVIDYAADRGLSWTAWAWYPGGCEFPSLIADWGGTATAEGQVVKAALAP